MRSFWGLYKNEKYRVGCNGNTIYIYDMDNKEIGKFKDIKYAYVGAFQPDSNIFVAKSTEGSLAIYDLDKMELIKKIVITKIGAQDEGFAFSLDGAYFYNIEKPIRSTKTQLTIYRTSDYEVVKVILKENDFMVLESLEFDAHTGEGYVQGFIRNASGVMDYGFIGKLVDENIWGMKRIEGKRYDYISAYKKWELSGFSKKKLEYSRMKTYSEKPHISLKQIYEEQS
ncbi:MAG: WD40 repeat domain-containing protein [Lachnospiraceae bacterium]|nr:WD40 repeat domain-containing protein [Lachnospiraceae bacterium]